MASNERIVAVQQQMQERNLASQERNLAWEEKNLALKERVMQLEMELTRLKGGLSPGAASAKGGGTYPSFDLGTGAGTSISLPQSAGAASAEGGGLVGAYPSFHFGPGAGTSSSLLPFPSNDHSDWGTHGAPAL
jgi:hypothetical protein